MGLNHRFLSPGWKFNKRVRVHLPLDLLHLGAIDSYEVCLLISAKNNKKARDDKLGDSLEVSNAGRIMEDALKTGKNFCEEKKNDVKQSVADTSLYDNVTAEMLDPNLVKEAEAEKLHRFWEMQNYDIEDRQTDSHAGWKWNICESEVGHASTKELKKPQYKVETCTTIVQALHSWVRLDVVSRCGAFRFSRGPSVTCHTFWNIPFFSSSVSSSPWYTTRVYARILHCVFLLTRWCPARARQRRHSEATWNQESACRNSNHRRLPSKPLSEWCSLFHGPPLPGSTSTQDSNNVASPFVQLRSYLNLPTSLPTTVTFKTCTFAAMHSQPTSFDPLPPRSNVGGG